MAGWLALLLTRQLASPKMLFADWPRRLLPAGHQALIASGSPRRINRFKEQSCVDGRAALLVRPANQASALSNAATLRVRVSNSTPTKWMGRPRWRYLAA